MWCCSGAEDEPHAAPLAANNPAATPPRAPGSSLSLSPLFVLLAGTMARYRSLAS